MRKKGGRRLGSVPGPCGSGPNAVKMAGRAIGGHGSRCGLLVCSASRRCYVAVVAALRTSHPFARWLRNLDHADIPTIFITRLERLDDIQLRTRPR